MDSQYREARGDRTQNTRIIIIILRGDFHQIASGSLHLSTSDSKSHQLSSTQSAGTVEYTDCISAEGFNSKECPGYDTKQSDGEGLVVLELWRMQSTLSLSSLPDLPWSKVVAPDRVLSIGQRELNWIVWNRSVYMYKNWFGIK